MQTLMPAAVPYCFEYRAARRCYRSVWRARPAEPEWSVYERRDDALIPVARDEAWYHAMLEHFLLTGLEQALPIESLHMVAPRKLSRARERYESLTKKRMGIPPLGKDTGGMEARHLLLPEYVI